ncbi:MAG: polymer-forming cytoskeletal protein [Leptothrix ochracea]|uniref:bactofilin family protein n=1 Tax=Leptothrix ochracea TaxID=735331 RepID=UPI0034E2C66B
MFGQKKQPAIRSLVGEGALFEGTLRFSDGLRIDGEVLGDVLALGGSNNMLFISEKAKVNGTVKAGHVIINGAVNGPVISTKMLELQSRAHIQGDIRYVALEMHQGAVIEGALNKMTEEEKAALIATN